MVGGSLTARTVKSKGVLLVDVPSLTVSVIVAEPFWFVAGWRRTVRLVVLPAKIIRFAGINVGLLDVAVTTRFDAAVSGSETLNEIGPVSTSSSVVTFDTLEIEGASAAPVTVNVNGRFV